MGNSIDKYSKNDPIFKAEFTEFIQNIKLENQDEHQNLHQTISSLRDQLDESKFTLKNNVQEAISSKNDEINQLKSTITELRYQLDKAQYEKKSAIQKEIQSSADEIHQLK